VIAVFSRLSETAASVESAATELRRQEWFDLDGEADPEAAATWSGALERPRSAASTFEWVADGWILSTLRNTRPAVPGSGGCPVPRRAKVGAA